MHKYRDVFCSGLLCLFLTAPAFGQTSTGTETRPAPSKQPSDNPTTPHGATWPHNDPRRQREESIEADRARKSGEMGYRHDSAPESGSPAGAGAQQKDPANREQSRGGEHQPNPVNRDKAETGDKR
jgi:hypothetical protein